MSPELARRRQHLLGLFNENKRSSGDQIDTGKAAQVARLIDDLPLALDPTLRSAVEAQQATEWAGLHAALALWEAQEIPALFCDLQRGVLCSNAGGQALLAEAKVLHLRDGEVRAVASHGEVALSQALARASDQTASARPRHSTVLLREEPSGGVHQADITRVPADAFPLTSGSTIMITVRRLSSDTPRRLLTQLGLTPSETDIVAALTAGVSPTELAVSRGRSLQTVRSQIKSAYQKLGVRGRGELMARFGRLA